MPTLEMLVYNRVEVTDPFGSYDITAVDIDIPSPGGLVSATEVASTACSKTYEYAWDTTGFAGDYDILRLLLKKGMKIPLQMWRI